MSICRGPYRYLIEWNVFASDIIDPNEPPNPQRVRQQRIATRIYALLLFSKSHLFIYFLFDFHLSPSSCSFDIDLVHSSQLANESCLSLQSDLETLSTITKEILKQSQLSLFDHSDCSSRVCDDWHGSSSDLFEWFRQWNVDSCVVHSRW